MTQLTIPSPCSEKWTDMAPVRPDCRFCAICARQITDFTSKTDAEILDHLRANKGKICGRFRKDQLSRPVRGRNATRRSGLTAAAASIAALLSAQQPAQNQSFAPMQTDEALLELSPTVKPAASFQAGKQDSLRVLSGKIMDADSEENLIGATVIVEGTSIGAITDIEGVFSLKLPLQLVQNQDIRLKILYTGFETVKLTVPEKIKTEDLAILPVTMKADDNMLTGIVVLGGIAYKPTFMGRVRHFFYRLFH